MKFATVFVAASLALSAFAEPVPIQKRALADYQAVFNGIKAQVAVVATNVASYVAGTVSGTVVQDASSDLVDIINAGATTVSGFAPLSNLEALALVAPIQDLTADVGDLVDAVVAAEPNFEADGLADDVLSSLQAQKTASEALRDAITPKVPAALRDIAAEMADGITAEIQRGIDAYSD